MSETKTLNEKIVVNSRYNKIWQSFKSSKTALISLFIVLAFFAVSIFGSFFLPYDPNLTEQNISNPQRPSETHWFGTDEQGRDIFSRVVDGTKVSILVGVMSVAFSLFFGTILGAISGYYGGKVDIIIMRIMDIMFAIPSILLSVCLMMVLGTGIDKAIVAIGLVAIPQYARIVRGNVLAEKENDYVKAAKIIGSSDIVIIFKNILPNILSSIIVKSTLGISTAILDVAALGFLGLGVKPPQSEWGTMLSESRKFVTQAPHTMIFPGAAISITVLVFNLLGDKLRDALDPKFFN
ncbi:MAG: ABC transporter permease [Oscillospiraceae bacterium]|jgi:ABC-type dipeptide/oligopeptide/nickel transport system permease subunit|nr:ABC transporter permease [Oscillospiraceae bacterium]